MPSTKSNSAGFDVAVIGGGVVGCAVARRLTREGARVVLVEKGADILSGASKGNSALLHTGFDAPPGSIELACMQEGYAEYRAIRAALNLPLLETGAIVAAWHEDELAKLDGIVAQAHENGVGDVRRLSAHDVLKREPHLGAAVLGGVLVPGEHVIDPWSAPLAYLTEAVANGAVLMRRSAVTGGSFESGRWRLTIGDHTVMARFVVNCAGLQGDRVEEALLGAPSFRIRPRKGQFVVFDKPAARLLGSIILPVPTERTKGIVLAPTIFGNVLIGPTAEEQDDRERSAVEHAQLEALVRRAAELVPELADVSVTAVYAGLRPATESKEYRIWSEPERHWLTLGGIRSTGLTAALGIARLASRALAAMGLDIVPPARLVDITVPALAETAPRDWQRQGYGEIVCHCEMVTRREIEAALSGPLGAGDYGGLRRRTRVGMGRCQGFYCGARVAELTEGRLEPPLAVGVAGR